MIVPVSFDYKKPSSVEEAVALLHQTKQSRPLAGGHELLVQVKQRRETPSMLVDLSNIPLLKKIGHSQDNSTFHIGAMVTCNDMIAHIPAKTNLGALKEAAASIGDAQVRNCTTMGGNLGGGNPAADLAAAILALEAEICVTGHFGSRVIAADQFYVGPFDTALEDDEIITKVVFPMISKQCIGVYEKIKNSANSYPICGVAAMITLTEKKLVSCCRVAVTGATVHPTRLHEVETAMQGVKPSAHNIVKASSKANKNQSFVSDQFVSDEYRAHLTNVLVERVLSRAAVVQ
jgi:carbon-monoxide dehydrogenase medium subunit